MASPTGGRVSVFQHILPTLGPGALTNRENAASSSEKKNDSSLLGPAIDFYKKLSLDCSGQQVIPVRSLQALVQCNIFANLNYSQSYISENRLPWIFLRWDNNIWTLQHYLECQSFLGAKFNTFLVIIPSTTRHKLQDLKLLSGDI